MNTQCNVHSVECVCLGGDRSSGRSVRRFRAGKHVACMAKGDDLIAGWVIGSGRQMFNPTVADVAALCVDVRPLAVPFPAPKKRSSVCDYDMCADNRTATGMLLISRVQCQEQVTRRESRGLTGPFPGEGSHILVSCLGGLITGQLVEELGIIP